MSKSKKIQFLGKVQECSKAASNNNVRHRPLSRMDADHFLPSYPWRMLRNRLRLWLSFVLLCLSISAPHALSWTFDLRHPQPGPRNVSAKPPFCADRVQQPTQVRRHSRIWRSAASDDSAGAPSPLDSKLEALFESLGDASSRSPLPIYTVLPELMETMASRSCNVLLEAPPGAGKTTIVPLAILYHYHKTRRIEKTSSYQIWMVEPRRVATRSAATRMASLLGEAVGAGTVGYQVRGEKRVSAETQITVVTDGILLQHLRSDPELTGIDMVIFDEFHERGVDSDVALALCRESQQLLRDGTSSGGDDDGNPPLQIIVMSATLLGDASEDDETTIASPATKLVRSLGGIEQCKILKSDGRQYPISLYHSQDLQWNGGRPLPLRILQRDRKELVNVMCDAIQQGVWLAPAKGDVLAFLPGAAEIRRTIQQLSESSNLQNDVEIVPLYGAQTKEQQDYALFPTSNKRRVIVSSPIAEASLTLERVTCVVDSGLRREPRCDVDTNMPRLVTVPCSQASAIQRAGRAGRVQEGICLRVYTSTEFEETMKDQSPPEILSTDLSPTVLLLVDWGCYSRENIIVDVPFVDPPPVESLDSAIRLLGELGAIAETNGRLSITPQGKHIAKLPTHPRFATAIEIARSNNDPTSLAAAIAVTFLLDDDTSIRAPNANSPDLVSRVYDLFSASGGDKRASQMVQALLKYASRFGPQVTGAVQDVLDDRIPLLNVLRAIGPALLPGFVDLVGELKGGASYGGSTYLLSNGRSARLDDYSPNDKWGESSQYVVVVDTSTGDDGKTRIRSFASVTKEKLLELSVAKEVLFTIPSQGHEVRARSVRVVGSLELESTPLPAPSADKVVEVLKETISNLGGYSVALTQSMPQDKLKELEELCQRVKLASNSSTKEDLPWPRCFFALGRQRHDDSSTNPVDDNRVLEEVVEPWIAAAGSLKKIDLLEILKSSLSPEQNRKLDNEFPARIEAPDGSLIPVSYTTDPPSATAKLQQFFGTANSPTVGPSHSPIRLSLSLLSPAGKIVAKTVDLPFFWRETYPQVRAELRGRYAKHPWPDDPMTAVATRQTKKQLSASDSATNSSDNGGSKKKQRGRKK